MGLGGNGSFSGGGLAGGGGPLGAMGMDIAPYRMPIIGSKFQNPNDIFKQAQFHQMARSLGQYRPEAQQAYSNAMNQTLSAMNPTNSALAQMYGPGAQQTNFSSDSGTGLRSPFGPSALQVGQSLPGLQGPGSEMATPSGGPQGLLGGLMGGGKGGMPGGDPSGMLGGLLGGSGASPRPYSGGGMMTLERAQQLGIPQPDPSIPQF